jgi:hypothetical protein
MSRGLVWITTFVFGAGATLMASFGPLAALLFLLLAAPLVVRGPHLVAVSGLLTGFGALWTFLIARQSAWGTRSDSAFWLAVGVTPLAIGVALLVGGTWRERARASSTHD